MDRDLLVSCVEQGMSTRQISIEFNKGQTTTRYWLKKFNLKTKNKSFSQGYNYPKRVDKNNQYCCECNIKLTLENAYNRKSRNIYTSYCKSCYSKYTLSRRLNFKKKCVDYKGGFCVSCGYDKDITALEFHHKNPQEKEINPSKMLNKSWDFIKNELDKCILLCSNCHREEHSIINKRKKQEKEFQVNFVLNFSSNILTGKNTGKKSCRRCDVILTEENTASGSHCYFCKSCDSKDVIDKGVKGKERTVEYMGDKCSICDYNKCITALEFHHLDPSKKSPTYNKRFRYWGFERQKKELENCIIVCGNCHREIHSKDEWKT
jgi:transposase